MDVSVEKPSVTCALGQMSCGETFKYNGDYFMVVGESSKGNRAVNLETGWLVEMNHHVDVEPIPLQVVLKN